MSLLATYDALKIMKKGCYKHQENTIYIKDMMEASIKSTAHYTDLQLDLLLKDMSLNRYQDDCTIEVEPLTTHEAGYREHTKGVQHITCLNFASARQPGGGFLNGSNAQEETLCRVSALYPTIVQMKQFYKNNKASKNKYYQDDLLFSPGVPFFKKSLTEALPTPIKLSVITAPAVNRGYAKRRGGTDLEIEEVMRMRADKILALAAETETEALILGAWGCGVFKNIPEAIAQIFKELIETKYRKAFKTVVFAIPQGSNSKKEGNYEIFKKVLLAL